MSQLFHQRVDSTGCDQLGAAAARVLAMARYALNCLSLIPVLVTMI
jgi:hypothetical protein